MLSATMPKPGNNGHNGKRPFDSAQGKPFGQDDTVNVAPATDTAPPATTPAKVNAALALLPFTPVPFSGSESFWAYGRIILYGVGATLVWEKHRKISYVLAGAAGLSLVTSLSASAYKK